MPQAVYCKCVVYYRRRVLQTSYIVYHKWCTGRDLEDADGLAHGGLDEEGLDVLPVLLEEGDEEVDAQHGVGSQLVLVHLGVADGGGEAQHLLELELDGALDLGDLLGEVLRVRHRRGELAGLVEPGAEQTGDLLDQGVRRQEDVVLLGQLLDQLLVLVQLLQVVSRAEVEAEGLGLVAVRVITDDAHAHVGLGGRGQTRRGA